MAALRNFESMLVQLTREYRTQLQIVAAPGLEYVGNLDEIYHQQDTLRKISHKKSLSRRQRKDLGQLVRATEILAMLAHTKAGDESMAVAREVYLKHRQEPEFLKSIDYTSLELHIDNARNNYNFAQRCFCRLHENIPLQVEIHGGEVEVVKFRGESLRAGNYIAKSQLEARSKYPPELYHAINSGAELKPRFQNWADTVGDRFLEIRPYIKSS